MNSTTFVQQLPGELALLAAILAGVSAILYVGLLQLPSDRPAAGWTAGLAMVTAALLVVAALLLAGIAIGPAAGDLSGPGVAAAANGSADGADPAAAIAASSAAASWAARALLVGIVGLFVSLGLAGWARPGYLGAITTLAALGLLGALGWTLSSLIGL